jgi:hypothetical protein
MPDVTLSHLQSQKGGEKIAMLTCRRHIQLRRPARLVSMVGDGTAPCRSPIYHHLR